MVYSLKGSEQAQVQISPIEKSAEMRRRVARLLRERRYFAKDLPSLLLEMEFALVADDIHYRAGAIASCGDRVDFLLPETVGVVAVRSDVMTTIGTALRHIQQRDAQNALVINWAMPFTASRHIYSSGLLERAVEVVDVYPLVFRSM